MIGRRRKEASHPGRRSQTNGPARLGPPDRPGLTVAVAKGRVEQQTRLLFSAAGSPDAAPSERALRRSLDDVELIYPHNWDVLRYLDWGFADAGIVGLDVLSESGLNLGDGLDLGVARCRLSLIRAVGAAGPIQSIATRYPRLAATYLTRVGRRARIITLGGNVELACLSGLADAVIDIVDTGATLRANHLVELDVVLESSARLILGRHSPQRRASVLDRLSALQGLHNSVGAPA
jgi:ATP phosphoribosyltransferase